MYADYEFYKNEYKGLTGESDFARLSAPAMAHIDRMTNNKATAENKAVKMAFCAIIDELDKQEHGGVIASESNDGISRSYANATVKTSAQRIYAAAELYLSSTNLLFTGV